MMSHVTQNCKFLQVKFIPKITETNFIITNDVIIMGNITVSFLLNSKNHFLKGLTH